MKTPNFNFIAPSALLILAFALPVCPYAHEFKTVVDISQLTALAEKGDVRSEAQLGHLYEQGNDTVKQDYAQAIKWYQKAADQDDASSEYNLSELYLKGHGIPQDYTEGAKWLLKAVSHQGAAEPQLQLSFLYLKGTGVPQDFQEAYFWHRICHGSQYHPYNSSDLEGYVEIKDFEIAGHLTQDQKQAVDKRVAEWRKKYAEQGSEPDQQWLAEMYEDGIGVPQSWEEAYFWRSLINAKRNRAVDSDTTKHLTQDQIAEVDKRVADWWHKAADKGDNWAQTLLAAMYFNGKGVPQDYSEAYLRYNLADPAGSDLNTKAMSQQAAKHLTADQVGAIDKRIQDQLLVKANSGDVKAQEQLAERYKNGKGVTLNNEEAGFWISLVAQKYPNMHYYQNSVADIFKQLSPEQAEAVKKRVQDWKPVPLPTAASP